MYFKGRDSQVDQIVELLEHNKFLMVTGASGEGKSSLVYGGLIPNARAGFFKSQYTNWVVADFRPERSPVLNMAKSLAKVFTQQPATIDTELRRGFSSLVDLYTNSNYYNDEQDDQWLALSDAEQKSKKRTGANLLILVDQFEEFFTNPENFFNEALSQDSQIVVNVILETARIALKRGLPIYVVCTMRSDYIGQCAAFRGLPEYIGFSQFFVPRLKRKDLKQVIEEPAILSGNRISQRLIERLVYDLEEGIDQLPILQHALSQIWLAADHGREEMDLIHYAMVGGMEFKDLPDDDQEKFQDWFGNLPEYKKNYFKETGLNKVIEIHANSLYEGAYEYYHNNDNAEPISRQSAKRIIALTFSCLTKIDNSRAVRNRMSLQEITEIINDPKLNAETVGKVINIYREEGNAFIRPFKTGEDASQNLSTETVLDITHESLIRNWNKLDDWASTEFNYYTTYLDFSTQLKRWKENGKSRNYLLPIGPLSYFENWYAQCKPNVGWIKRYVESKPDDLAAHDEAAEMLSDIREFLKRSARKVAIARAFMKYGTQRIAAFLAIVIMLSLSGFYWYDAELKQNDRVIKDLRNQADVLLTSPEIDNDTKADYLLVEERLEPGSLIAHLESSQLRDKVGLSIDVYQLMMEFDNHFNPPIKEELIKLIYELLSSGVIDNDEEYTLIKRNKFLSLLTYDEYYTPNSDREKYIRELTKANYSLVSHFFNTTSLYKPTVPVELNQAIQFWLTFGQPSEQQIDDLISLISPDGSENALKAFNTYYPRGSFEPNGRQSNDFNGGYHTLASLYGALGDLNRVTWCFKTIMNNDQMQYLEQAGSFNNHLNVIGYLYQYGHRDKALQLIKWISTNTKDNPPTTLFRNLVIRAGYNSWLYGYNVYKQSNAYKGYFNPNLCMADRSIFYALMDDYENEMRKETNIDERNYLLAMNAKRKAIFIHKYNTSRGLEINKEELDNLFEKAVKHSRLISPVYQMGKVSITVPYFTDGVRTRQYTRRELLLYPDYMDGWFDRPFHSDVFFNYLKDNKLLTELYKTQQDLELLHLWLSKAFEESPRADLDYKDYEPLPDQTLISILDFVASHPQGNQFDSNLPILILGNRAFDEGNAEKGLSYFRQLDLENIQRSYDRYEYIEKTFFLNQMKDLSVSLALGGNHKEAVQLAEAMKEKTQRVFSYISMAEKVYSQDTSIVAFSYLDSVMSINKTIDFNNLNIRDNRFDLVEVLSRIGGRAMNEKAMEIMRDFSLNERNFGTILMIWGVAKEGNYHRALTSIPTTFTEEQDLICRDIILYEESKKRESQSSVNTWSAMDKFYAKRFEYIFYQPN